MVLFKILQSGHISVFLTCFDIYFMSGDVIRLLTHLIPLFPKHLDSLNMLTKCTIWYEIFVVRVSAVSSLWGPHMTVFNWSSLMVVFHLSTRTKLFLECISICWRAWSLPVLLTILPTFFNIRPLKFFKKILRTVSVKIFEQILIKNVWKTFSRLVIFLENFFEGNIIF